MSKENGHLKSRRGIWQHVRDGRMSLQDVAVQQYIASQADTRCGIWRGSASALAGELCISPRIARRFLDRLTHGDYIRRFPIPGKHVCYPILVHKFEITDGEHRGEQLNALGSISPVDLRYFPGEHRGEHVSSQKRIEKREVRKNQTPAAKPAPPIDPRHKPVFDSCFEAYREKYGVSPTWGGREGKSLQGFLKEHLAISASGDTATCSIQRIAGTRTSMGLFLIYSRTSIYSRMDQFSRLRRKGESMRTNALTTTLPQPDCSRTEQLARGWAVTFAELFRVSLKDRGPRFVDLWVSALADLKPEIFDAACQRVMKVCKFFPTPAEIREHIDSANSRGLELEAEEAWQQYLTHLKRYFHPDIGWNRHAPQLSAIVEHAARAAGGPNWIESCPEEKLQWCRKTFIEAYLLAHETSQVAHLLTRGQARNILAQLTKEPPRMLPAPEKPPISEPEQKVLNEAAAREWEKFETEIRVPRPAPAPISEEEWNKRRDEQLARLRAHLVAHPELTGDTAPKREDQEAPQ